VVQSFILVGDLPQLSRRACMPGAEMEVWAPYPQGNLHKPAHHDIYLAS
jgi:hypothetical protein